MRTVIFLNGEIPGKKVVNKYLKNTDFVIAADGGANYLMKERILPDLIIGDLDSISRKSQLFFSNKRVEILKIREQETTDFEKCLKYCKKNKVKDIIVFGATSMRPDHTLNNFSVLKRYKSKAEIKFVSDEFEIFYVNKSAEFRYRAGETVSFLAFPVARGVRTKGLKYRLKGEKLEFGIREGTLNKSVSDKISVKIHSGNLLLFKKHFYN